MTQSLYGAATASRYDGRSRKRHFRPASCTWTRTVWCISSCIAFACFGWCEANTEALPACTDAMISSVITDCGGQESKKKVYFYNRPCDDTAVRSAKLPSPETLPCQCSPGLGISAATLTCTACAPGMYGPGGRVLDPRDWARWNLCPSGLYVKEDVFQMSTFCETGNLSVVTNIYHGSPCQPWRPGPVMDAPLPTPGFVVPSACTKKDQQYRGAHEYLVSGVQPDGTRVLSVLHTVIEVVRLPAMIEFTYFVDASPCFGTTSRHCDGLSFYIDNDETMTTQSQQLTWQKMTFSIENVGFHSLRWQMRITDVDDSQAAASNKAALRSMVLVGVEGNTTCAPCPPGSFSPTQNSSSCTLCPEFHYQNGSGQSQCFQCPNGTYSLMGSSRCFTMRKCGVGDLLKHLADISTCVHDAARNVYVRNETVGWLHHFGYSVPLCDKHGLPPSVARDREVQCHCEPGQSFVSPTSGTPPYCENCPKGWHSSDGLTCYHCPYGSITTGERTITTWSTLPDGFSCLGCQAQQWLPNGDSLRTGYSTASYDLQLVWDGITITQQDGGYLEFTCSVDCSLAATGGGGGGGGAGRPIGPRDSVTFTSHCHLEFLLDDQSGLHEPVACAPPELRNGTVLKHRVNLPAGDYRFIWFYHQLDVHFAQSIGMEGRLHELTVVGLNSSKGGASHCTPCLAGFHQNSDQTACLACPVGTFSHASSYNCTVCPPGTVAPTNMSGSCRKCPPGSFSESSSHCALCQPGTFSPGGTDTCETCAQGTFSDKPGADKCASCGSGTTNSHDFTTCDNKQCRPILSANASSSSQDNATGQAGVGDSLYRYDFSHLGTSGGEMVAASQDDKDGAHFYMNLCTVEHDKSHCVNSDGQPIDSMVCAETCYPANSSNCTAGKSYGDVIGWEFHSRENITINITNGDLCADGRRKRSARIRLHCALDADNGTDLPQLLTPLSAADCHVEFLWNSRYACPICTENCYRNSSGACHANGTRLESRVRVQACWGGNVTGSYHNDIKCITIYVVIGAIVAFSLFVFIIFYLVRSQHMKTQADRIIHSRRMQDKLSSMSDGAIDDDLIDTDYEYDQESGGEDAAETDDEMIN